LAIFYFLVDEAAGNIVEVENPNYQMIIGLSSYHIIYQ